MKRVIAFLLATFYLGVSSHIAYAQFLADQERVVASGQRQKIGWRIYLDPACHSMGAGSLGLIDPPRLGSVTVRQGREYPSFGFYNPRSLCNTRKVPATQLIYSTAPGTVGEDSFTVEYIGPLGNPLRQRYHVVVR